MKKIQVTKVTMTNGQSVIINHLSPVILQGDLEHEETILRIKGLPLFENGELLDDIWDSNKHTKMD